MARRTGLDISDIQELESVAKASNRQRDDLALIQAILEEVGSSLSSQSVSSFGRRGLETLR